MFLSLPGFCWLSRICRERRSGSPASCSVDSWRVNRVIRFSGMPPKEMLRPPFFFLAPGAAASAFFFLSPLDFCSLTAVGYRPSARSFACASSGEEASMVPRLVAPVAFTASYV